MFLSEVATTRKKPTKQIVPSAEALGLQIKWRAAGADERRYNNSPPKIVLSEVYYIYTYR